MQYVSYYNSNLGKILLSSDENRLTGLWFEGQKYYGAGLYTDCTEKETSPIKCAKNWLDIYFTGKNPDFTPPLQITGSPFRLMVYEILKNIPYGKTVTYQDIAQKIEAKTGKIMSPRPVGGAVGHNRILIIIPCHRVVGKNSLTGYAAGTDRKLKLLNLECRNTAAIPPKSNPCTACRLGIA